MQEDREFIDFCKFQIISDVAWILFKDYGLSLKEAYEMILSSSFIDNLDAQTEIVLKMKDQDMAKMLYEYKARILKK